MIEEDEAAVSPSSNPSVRWGQQWVWVGVLALIVFLGVTAALGVLDNTGRSSGTSPSATPIIIIAEVTVEVTSEPAPSVTALALPVQETSATATSTLELTAIPSSTPSPTPTFLFEGQFPPGSISELSGSTDSQVLEAIPYKFRAVGFTLRPDDGFIDPEQLVLPAGNCGWANGAGLESETANLPDGDVLIIFMCLDTVPGTYTFTFELLDGQQIETPFLHTSPSP
jgi:hypothetical protein